MLFQRAIGLSFASAITASLLGSCTLDDGLLGELVLSEVEPAIGRRGAETAIEIRGDNFAPVVFVSYANPDNSDLDGGFTATLGDEALLDVTWRDRQTLTATVPGSLPLGLYDLQLTGPRGGTPTLVDAFEVICATDATWYADADGDGFGDPADTVEACAAPEGYVGISGDCDGSSAVTFPGSAPNDDPDACAKDADDDDFGDADPPAGVTAGTDCDDEPAGCGTECHPGQPEVCDAADNDCDPATADGSSDPLLGTACDGPDTDVCTDDSYDLCDAGVLVCSTGADEVEVTCDGIDQDCDGLEDDAPDGDADGYDICAPGTIADADGRIADCDDTELGVYPGAVEIPCNARDDDCDPRTEDTAPTWYRDADGDGAGDPGDAITDCSQPDGYVSNALDCDDDPSGCGAGCSPVGGESVSALTCGNAADDDCDGFVDVADAGCGPWWRCGWGRRVNLEVRGQGAEVPAGYSVPVVIDHAAWAGAGTARVDGDDVRAVCWDGVTWEEVDRILDPDSAWDDPQTTLWLRWPAMVGAQAADRRCYLYYDNPSAPSPPANEGNVFLFGDLFDRPDNDIVGRGWRMTESTGDIDVASDGLVFTVAGDLDNRPLVDHAFEPRTDGVAWRFGFNWERTGAEEFYRVHAQLGDSATWEDPPAELDFFSNVGIGPSLLWAAPNQGMREHEFFGYEIGGALTELQVTSGPAAVEIRADVPAGTYDVWIDGVAKAIRLPFSSPQTRLDRVRLFTWQANENNFATRRFDYSLVRRHVSPEPAVRIGSEELPPPAQAASCVGFSPCDWQYRKAITVAGAQVGADLTDFPLLIDLSADADLAASAQAGGADVLFTAADGTTRLAHEIERYDAATGALVAWVEVPSLAGTADTVLYLYYGNPSAPAQANPAAVWDAGYEAVYHLHDDPLDSTANARGAEEDGTGNVAGAAGDGRSFAPISELYAGNWSVAGSALTLQAWVNPTDFSQTEPRAISKARDRLAEDHVFMLGLGGSGDQYPRVRIKTGADDGAGTVTLEASTGALTAGVWSLLAATYDGTTLRLFLDGAEVANAAVTGELRENGWGVWLGNNAYNDDDPTWAAFNGGLDELRVSSAVRSAEWLTTEFTNVSSPGTFYTLGAPEARGGTCGW